MVLNDAVHGVDQHHSVEWFGQEAPEARGITDTSRLLVQPYRRLTHKRVTRAPVTTLIQARVRPMGASPTRT
jgi:hypothetical protein